MDSFWLKIVFNFQGKILHLACFCTSNVIFAVVCPLTTAMPWQGWFGSEPTERVCPHCPSWCSLCLLFCASHPYGSSCVTDSLSYSTVPVGSATRRDRSRETGSRDPRWRSGFQSSRWVKSHIEPHRGPCSQAGPYPAQIWGASAQGLTSGLFPAHGVAVSFHHIIPT